MTGAAPDEKAEAENKYCRKSDGNYGAYVHIRAFFTFSCQNGIYRQPDKSPIKPAKTLTKVMFCPALERSGEEAKTETFADYISNFSCNFTIRYATGLS